MLLKLSFFALFIAFIEFLYQTGQTAWLFLCWFGNDIDSLSPFWWKSYYEGWGIFFFFFIPAVIIIGLDIREAVNNNMKKYNSSLNDNSISNSPPKP